MNDPANPRFCPRCGQFYPPSGAAFCSRDGVALDQIDHARDSGPQSLTGQVLGDKFILKRQLGEGGMGAVYLAVQKPMGREVAVKTLFAHLTHDPQHVERALREAEATNQVDHPNVITIYDSGRTREGLVYIAMEYLRGENLAQLLDRQGHLPPEQALRLWLPAVRAMASAHQRGVIHRDLKPDNLFVVRKQGDDGQEELRIKLLDFGLAKLADRRPIKTDSGAVLGTLLYMAPEQLQGLDITPAADVYALGLILVELLTGRLPWRYVDEAEHTEPDAPKAPAPQATQRPRGEVAPFQRMFVPPEPLSRLLPAQPFSAELQRLLDAALAIEPAERPADAGELLRLAEQVPELFAQEAEPELGQDLALRVAAPVCPFPGLESFDEEDARFFCGRDEDVRAALARIGATPEGHKRWLQIEGASGSGKSSLARAGLLPAVRHGQIAGAPPIFGVAVIRPGRDPVASLAPALCAALSAPDEDLRELPALSVAEVEERLRRTDQGLRDLIAERVPPGQALLLMVDQLEEALTQAGDDRAVLGHFDGLLATALEAPASPLYLITTIRSDLVGHFHALPRLEAALNEAARYYLRPMSEAGLRQAIAEPARLSGLYWEKGLIERIIADTREAQGSLPLLGHVLRALWKQRDGRLLTKASYERLGGVSGALTRSADALLESLGPAGVAHARRLLLRLVKIGRGGPDTRQSITRAEALKVAEGAQGGEELLLRLSGKPAPDAPPGAPPSPHLLVVSEQRVDLVHESLLHRWRTLRGWLEGSRKMLERRDDLEATAQVWEATGHKPEGLPAGGLLAYYEGVGLDERERESLRVMLSERAGSFLRAAREGERQRERERRRRQQQVVLGLGAFLVVMTAMAAFAFVQRSRARREQAHAESVLRNALQGANQVNEIIDGELRRIVGATRVRRNLLSAVSGLLDELRKGARDDAGVLRSRMVSHQQRGDLARTNEDTQQALREYTAAVEIAKQLQRRDPLSPQVRLGLLRSHRLLGDMAFEAGSVRDAQDAFAEALELSRALLAEAPESPEYLLEQGQCQRRKGDVDARRGQVESARVTYQQSAEIFAALLRRAPDQLEYRYAAADVGLRLGDTLTQAGRFKEAGTALEASLVVTRELLQREPSNGEYRSMLGMGRTREGNLLLELGRLEEAERAYREAMETYQSLLAADPSSVAYRRALASTFRSMGDVTQRMGRLTRARAAYEECLKLRQQLAAADPSNEAYRQGVATAFGSLGDLFQTAGRFAEARGAYAEALKLKRARVEADPQNAFNRLRLGLAFISMADVDERVGDHAAAHHGLKQGLELLTALAAADPKNAHYQEELGTAYSKLGVVAAGRGDAAAALAAHKDALRLHRGLVAQNPQTALYRQELAMSHMRYGETLERSGAIGEAIRSYEEALQLRTALAAGNDKNTQWQRDLLFSHLRLGQAERARPRVRRQHLAAAAAILPRLVAAGMLDGDQQLTEARAQLARFK